MLAAVAGAWWLSNESGGELQEGEGKMEETQGRVEWVCNCLLDAYEDKWKSLDCGNSRRRH